MASLAKDRKKIEGHRASIEEHIEKYKTYDMDGEKQKALKTIENTQNEIKKILARNTGNIEQSWKDTWKPE